MTGNVYVQAAEVLLASAPCLNGVSSPERHGRTLGPTGSACGRAGGGLGMVWPLCQPSSDDRTGQYCKPCRATSRVDLPGRILLTPADPAKTRHRVMRASTCDTSRPPRGLCRCGVHATRIRPMALQHRPEQSGGRPTAALRAAAPIPGRAANRLPAPHRSPCGRASVWLATLVLAALAGCRSSADPFRNVKYRTTTPRQNHAPPQVDEGPQLPGRVNPSPGLYTPPPYTPALQGATSQRPALEDEDRPLLAFDPIQQVAGYAPAGTGAIHGRVIDASGRPQSGVSVVAVTTPGGEGGETTTDANGSFGFHGLVVGQRYLLLASAIHAREPLIGRVAVTAPNQSVVIEIARPFAGGRQGSAPTQSVPGLRQPEMAALPTPKSSSQDSPRDRRQQPGRYNQPESPWDTPAPPTRTTPGARPIAPQAPSPNGDNPQWRTASSVRSPNGAAPPGLSTQSAATPRSQIPATRAARPLDSSSGPPGRTPIARSTPTEPQTRAGDTSTSEEVRPPIARPTQITSVPPPPRSAPTGVARNGDGGAPPPFTPAPARSEATQPLLDLGRDRDKAVAGAISKTSPASAGSVPSCQFEGDRLVDFQLFDLQLQPVSFRGLDSRFVLLDFWGTWCTPCLRAVPHLTDLQQRYGPYGLQVIGVAYPYPFGPGENVSERVAAVQRVRGHLNINYPVLLGAVGGPCPVLEKFQVHSYPTLVLLDKSGRVVWRSESPTPPELQRLEIFLKTQLASRPNGYK